MQIHSCLDIEFFIPQFIRKKFTLRKETIESGKPSSSSLLRFFSKQRKIPEALKNYKRPPEDDDDPDAVMILDDSLLFVLHESTDNAKL